MNYELHFTKGILAGERREVGDYSFLVLGRGESKCNVSIAPKDCEDTSISRKHLTAYAVDAGLQITNHASIEGTSQVDGVNIPPKAVVIVKPGSVVSVGLKRSVEFRVEIPSRLMQPPAGGTGLAAQLDEQYAAMGLQDTVSFSEPPPESLTSMTVLGTSQATLEALEAARAGISASQPRRGDR